MKAVVIGWFQGAAYGLLAVGIVLVYKGARVFNFAQGEFGTVAAFVTWSLFRNAHLPYLVAAVVGLAAAVLLGILVERAVVRPLLDAPRITLLVATLGVALLIIALIHAFTGAVLGGMTSLPGAFVGGLLVGVAQNLGTHYLPASFPGGASFTVFCLLLAVLLVRPQGLLGKEA